MNREMFTSNMSGLLLTNLQGVLTFEPHPLPPKGLSFPMPLLRQFCAVDNTLGQLEGTAKGLPDRRILVRSFVRREAQLSRYIENTSPRYEAVAAAAEGGGRGEVAEPVR